MIDDIEETVPISSHERNIVFTVTPKLFRGADFDATFSNYMFVLRLRRIIAKLPSQCHGHRMH